MGSKKTDLMRISYFVAIVILVCLIGNLKDLWLQSWTDLIIYLIVLFAAAECLFSTLTIIIKLVGGMAVKLPLNYPYLCRKHRGIKI